MQINDVVAVNADPFFRDNHYHARQYGRVIAMQAETEHSRLGPFAVVDWSDVGMGEWTPRTPETYHVGNLRVIA